jgi:hypothetical protein
MHNLYFDLTRELNEEGAIAVLASGQAVVFYRLAMMSKDSRSPGLGRLERWNC